MTDTKSHMVAIGTNELKEKLNKAYCSRFQKTGNSPKLSDGLFNYLWDLKEKALLEHQTHIEIPDTMLDELETNSDLRH